VTLASARAERDANKALLAKGVDPSAQRKIDRRREAIARSNTFRIVGDELLEKFALEGDDPKDSEEKEMAAKSHQMSILASAQYRR
jgi:hypothetical protein